MTDYTQLTGIEDGKNAFTSVAKSTLITAKDRAHAALSGIQTKRVASEKAKGKDISSFYGISAKSDELIAKTKAITKFKHAPAFNVAIATADDSRRTAAIKGRG